MQYTIYSFDKFRCFLLLLILQNEMGIRYLEMMIAINPFHSNGTVTKQHIQMLKVLVKNVRNLSNPAFDCFALLE